MKHDDSMVGIDLRTEDHSWILFDADVYKPFESRLSDISKDKLCLWVDMGKQQGAYMVLPTRNFITHGDEPLFAANRKLGEES